MPYLIAEPSLAEKELGFKAPQDLETMCRDLWNWQTKNPNGYEDDILEVSKPVNGSLNQKLPSQEVQASCVPDDREKSVVGSTKVNGH